MLDMLEHFYGRIGGYFTFPDFYTWLAGEVGHNAHLVEVGCYEGQSAAYLGVELMNKKPGARLDLVDIFTTRGGVEAVRAALTPIHSILGDLHVGESVEVAKLYADKSIDAVFIDADHTYEAVSKDIDAWRPKVKEGGILAGHDYTTAFEGVIRAVNERFERYEVWRGVNFGGDAGMMGKYWPVWCVRVG
jgi:predicted O-methyltransferase YrrM